MEPVSQNTEIISNGTDRGRIKLNWGEPVLVGPYLGREQTEAKHFILKGYLQELAFKVLHFSDITYVDGFSGPWETQTESFEDSSFMIAISALRDAQKAFQAQGKRRRIRCFFSENNPKSFAKLQAAVTAHHAPQDLFEITTYCGDFEDAVPTIIPLIGNSFPLIFIDPTGWTGYAFDKIKPLFKGRLCEVLINFMYEFINRFIYSDDPIHIASLDPILGGPGWRDRLDPGLPRGLAVEKLFRDTLRQAGGFDYVVSTKIDKATEDRPHFMLAYGTKKYPGLKAFRDIEYKALRAHAKNRAGAKERKAVRRTGLADMFADHEAQQQEATVDDLVAEHKLAAVPEIVAYLQKNGSTEFIKVAAEIMQARFLRETNVKDLLVDLAGAGRIANTWTSTGARKPSEDHIIKLP